MFEFSESKMNCYNLTYSILDANGTQWHGKEKIYDVSAKAACDTVLHWLQSQFPGYKGIFVSESNEAKLMEIV